MRQFRFFTLLHDFLLFGLPIVWLSSGWEREQPCDKGSTPLSLARPPRLSLCQQVAGQTTHLLRQLRVEGVLLSWREYKAMIRWYSPKPLGFVVPGKY